MNHVRAETRSYPPAVSPDRPSPDEQQPRWVPVVVIGVLLASALVVTSLGGAFGLARNDDWSYADLLWRWYDTGDLRLGGWESMTLLGQLLLAWPLAAAFPRNVASLQLFTLGMAAVGAAAAYGALRRFLTPARALLGAAVALMGPLFAPLALSFMTDIPAFAVQSVCVWLGAVALTTPPPRNARWFGAAMVVGLFGVTIREYAVVAPLAVLAVFCLQAWGRRDRHAQLASAIAAVGGAVFVAAFIGWRRSWARSLSLQPTMPTSITDALSAFGRSSLFTVCTLAFLVLPVFLFVPVRELLRRLTAARWGLVAVASALVVLVAGAVSTWEWSPPLLGPYLDQRGALGNDILPGNRELIAPTALFRIGLIATLVASILLVGVLVLEGFDVVRRGQDWRARCAALDAQSLAWMLVVGTVMSLTAAGVVGLPIFDRYVLPAVPFAAGVLLAWQPGRRSITARTTANAMRWIGVAVFLVVGVGFATDSARFDAARWDAGERAVELGYPADRVDAGFEWRNVHRPVGEAPTSPSQPDPDACVRLAAPNADLGPEAVWLFEVSYWHGLAGTEQLTAWAIPGTECPLVP